MEPASEHEREIARLIDDMALQGHLPLSAVLEIEAALKFRPSKEETQFLVRYVLWRRDRQTLL
jgi:hypothetical protein